MKLLYNEKDLLCTKIKFLSFKLTLPMAKLDIVGSRVVSDSLLFSGDTLVNMELITFLLLSNVSELSIGTNAKKFW